ncbi:hypothetical protein DFH07DRAFT_555271 [Mycena maculata]|uniref:Uncharacterized protein n=1 Tax=Mycena maculata TaxID=230809 RepID=A0AAD7N8C6_9AGAR|nr:hypothetical protein DFH07DRAFT_555271 [Mycena maculata]
MVDFPITEAQLVGLFLESVFWGFYLVTLVLCLRTLLFNANLEFKRPNTLTWTMLSVTVLMGTFATVDVATGLLHNTQAFVLYKGQGGATQEFSNISDWVNIIRTVDTLVQTLLGDGMLIYRCWVVYGRSWRVVAFSILLWCGAAGCTGMVLHLEGTLRSNALITSGSLHPPITSFWLLTITLNLLTTGLLVFKIWRVDRENARFTFQTTSAQYQPSTLRKVMRIIIESGLMYTVVAFLVFITYIFNSYSVYPTSDVEVQIVGIAFNLILIRASANSQPMDGQNSTAVALQIHRPHLASDSANGVMVTVEREFDGRGRKDTRSLNDVPLGV